VSEDQVLIDTERDRAHGWSEEVMRGARPLVHAKATRTWSRTSSSRTHRREGSRGCRGDACGV